jgi:hypothetical protein
MEDQNDIISSRIKETILVPGIVASDI